MVCGVTPVRLEADHIVPLARGGANDHTNLRTLCVPCHRKRNRDHGRFAADREQMKGQGTIGEQVT